MKHAFVLLSVLGLALMLGACGGVSEGAVLTSSAASLPASSGTEAPQVSASSSTPAPSVPEEAFSGVAITEPLLEEILRCTEGLRDPDTADTTALHAFLAAHPDFLYEQVSRCMSSTGDTVNDGGDLPQLLVPPGVSPGDDLLGRERLAQFAEHVRAGVSDSIAIITPGSTAPVWVSVYTFDGGTNEFTLENYTPFTAPSLQSPPAKIKLTELWETDTEWRLAFEPNLKIRYPKYGYEAIALGSGAASQAQAQQLLEPFVTEHYPGIVSLAPAPHLDENSEAYYRFEGLDAAGSHDTIGTDFAVAKDLSHFYEIESGFGMWLLQARVKSAP